MTNIVRELSKKYPIEATGLNFGVLNRKLLSFDIVLDDLKGATKDKEEGKALEEISNLKEILTSLDKELNLK